MSPSLTRGIVLAMLARSVIGRAFHGPGVQTVAAVH